MVLHQIPDGIPQIECDFLTGDPKKQVSAAHIERFAAKYFMPLMPGNIRIVTFDGFDGAGKSPLAKGLAAALGCRCIGLDDYLHKNMGRFLGALKFNELGTAISGAKKVVVEGCLVETVLEHLNCRTDFRIYVMEACQPPGIPGHEYAVRHDVLYNDKSLDELIAQDKAKRKLAARFLREPENGDDESNALWLELARYHVERRPHDSADAIVKVIQESG